MASIKPQVLSISLLALVISLSTLGATPFADYPRAVRKAIKSIKPKECFNHVKILASDDYEGRAAGTEGGRKAGEYMAAAFEKMGLEAGGKNGRFFQRFSIRGKRPKPGSHALTNRLYIFDAKKGKRYPATYGSDFVPHPYSANGRVSLPVKYVPESSKSKGDGFIALVVHDLAPPEIDRLSSLNYRAIIAITATTQKIDAWPPAADSKRGAIPVVRLNKNSADKFLRKLGTSLKKLAKKSKALSLGKRLGVVEVLEDGYGFARGRNVIGILRGHDEKLKDECVVIGAHYDHIGKPTDPRLTKGRLGEIHNGADDNASGSAGLIEMAEAFANSKVKFKRTLIFIAFDAEEAGLLGSQHYCADPPEFSMENTTAMINIDMISRNKAQEIYFGTLPKFSKLNRLVEKVAHSVNVELDPTGMEQYIKRSDQWSFMSKGVPAVFLYGGDHPQYHTQDDDLKLINPLKISNISKLMFLAAWICANHPTSLRPDS